MMAALKGRRQGASSADLLAEEHFLTVDSTSSTFTYGPFPVPSDPYDVEFTRVSTLDSVFNYALDRYRVFTERK
jgi:hypothetical protein